MRRTVILAALLAGCSSSSPPSPTPADMSGPDMTPYPRTLVTRPLMPTPVQNLIKDPFVGADGDPDYGQFYAVFDDGNGLQLTRTFESVSPVGGAVSIETVPFAGASGGGTLHVLDSFLGGAGLFYASLWISIADSTGAPKTWASVKSSVSVYVFDNNDATQYNLGPVATGPVTYGKRSWIELTLDGNVELPAGGWLDIDISDPTLDVELAAPVVLSSELLRGRSTRYAIARPLTDDHRTAVLRAREHTLHVHHRRPR